MAELARGTVADRPWGRTLGALGMRGLTGQLTLFADNRRYCTAFVRGAVVGATSPLPTDSAVRVALTSHLISSTQVADIARRSAAQPERDEIDVLAELARLSPDQAMRLRRRCVAQRASRTFSIDRGEFLVDDEIQMYVVPGSELDIRAVIYLGARQNLSEQRLASELGQIGTWFLLKADVIEDLPQYGFQEAERPVLEMLREGADLSELERAAPGIEQRMVRSVVYSLASCNAFEPDGSPRAASMRASASNRSRNPSERPNTPEPTRFKPGASGAPPRPGDNRGRPGQGPQLEARTFTTNGPLPGRARTTSIDLPPRTVTPPSVTPPNTTMPPPFEGRARTTSLTNMPVESRTRTPVAPPVEGRARTTSIPGAPRTTTPPSRFPGKTSIPPPPPSDSDDNSGIRFKASDSGPVRARTATDPTPPVKSRTRTDPSRAPSNRTRLKTDPSLPIVDTDRFAPGSNRYRTTIPPMSGTQPPPMTADGLDRTRMREPTPIRVSETRRRADSTAPRIEQLIDERLQLLDSGADHFQLIGVQPTASMDQVRNAYYDLARQLHPDRLASMGITDPNRQAHRLFAQVNTAFAILSDAKRRKEYTTFIQRGGESAVRQEEKKVDELAQRLLGAEEAFKRGEMALRRDALPQAIEEFKKAVELNKDEAEYQAMLTWALFCAAPDKMAIASETRKSLDRLISKSSQKSVTARFYLGRVERMLGRDREALNHFHGVLEVAGNHAEATSEIRVIESRLANPTDDKSRSGIFGRLKR